MKVILNTLPCGYTCEHPPFATGRMRELQKHYSKCQHPYCRERLAKWRQIVAAYQAERAAFNKQLKGVAK